MLAEMQLASKQNQVQVLGDGVAAWGATVNGLADYWAAAWSRGATPLTLTQDLARWRDFSHGSRDAVIATLVLPPQAGHDSCVVDFSPEQSQVQEIRRAGLTRV